MKAVMLFGPLDMRVVDMPMISPAPHEALVRVESTGLCGSDSHYYLDGRIGSTVVTEPLVLGHEYAGIVEAVGAEADASLVGKRVAVEPGVPCLQCEWCRKGRYNICRSMAFPGGPPYHGAFREYMTVHAGFCFPVPDGMGADIAAMIEPLAVAVHTVELARLTPGDTVAVLGLGPIGLLTARVASLMGAGVILGSDPVAYRREAALRYGVDQAFDPHADDLCEAVMQVTSGRGVDVAFDCARSTETPGDACRITCPGGRMVLTGISGHAEGVFPVDVARRKELSLSWCRRFCFNYPAAIQMAATGRVDVASLITHRFPLEGTPEAFELMCNMLDGVLKVSIDQ